MPAASVTRERRPARVVGVTGLGGVRIGDAGDTPGKVVGVLHGLGGKALNGLRFEQ